MWISLWVYLVEGGVRFIPRVIHRAMLGAVHMFFLQTICKRSLLVVTCCEAVSTFARVVWLNTFVVFLDEFLDAGAVFY